MGFWKSLFKAPLADKATIEESAQKNDTYELEWRNRFLIARKEHLSKKLRKAGRGLPNFEAMPEHPQAQNEVLIKQVERLEDMI